jgi:4-diphosphocytidyl-2-C-methyl-D-erythritol kinase
VRCPAKVNLGLWILRRREDGYHDVDTILQAINFEDELILEQAGSPGLELTTRGRAIPGPGPNLIERAWSLVAGRAEQSGACGVRVTLTKRIPIGAGLGGGSSDAAGFLAGVNRLLSLGIAEPELESLGSSLGADVPFFFRGGTARGRGRGDQLRQLCPTMPFWVVLASPPLAISTSWAYGQVKNDLTPRAEAGTLLASAVASQDWEGLVGALHNVFEDVVLPNFPSLAMLKRAMHVSGARKVLLAGSGSTLFGVVRSRDDALAVAKGIAGSGAEVRVARTLERGVTVAPLG